MNDGDGSLPDDFGLSEALVGSRSQKSPCTTALDFNGLLKTPLQLHEDLKDGCGGQLWPAGMVLATYLLREPQIASLEGKKILELGAGGGLVGLAIAIALKEKSAENLNRCSGSSICITDQKPMLSLMQQNIALNELPDDFIEPYVLDWGASLENLPSREAPDIMLAADCVYFEPAFPLLLQTMRDLIGPKTICYFCFKKRRKADMRFLKEARKTFVVEDIINDPDRPIWSREALFLFKITRKLSDSL